MIPSEAVVLSGRDRVALGAVLGGTRSVRAVQSALGYRSSSTAHLVLLRLRKHGLVIWDEGKDGTLRPAVRVVA